MVVVLQDEGMAALKLDIWTLFGHYFFLFCFCFFSIFFCSLFFDGLMDGWIDWHGGWACAIVRDEGMA